MAQVDKVSYLPLLFWFLILFLVVYISVGFFYIPKTFGIIKTRSLYLKKLLKRFFKYYRQFKFNLRCMGHVELTELAFAANAVNFSFFRLPFLK